LSKEAKSKLQDGVDKITTQFISAVSHERGVSTSVVTSQFGQGAAMFADEAKAAGMIDAVGSLDLAFSRSATPNARRASIAGETARGHLSPDGADRSAARRRRLELLRRA
jgi:ClpP class serine protease